MADFCIVYLADKQGTHEYHQYLCAICLNNQFFSLRLAPGVWHLMTHIIDRIFIASVEQRGKEKEWEGEKKEKDKVKCKKCLQQLWNSKSHACVEQMNQTTCRTPAGR